MSYNINIHYITRPTPCKGYQTIDTHLSDPVTQLAGGSQFQECNSGFLVRTGTKVRKCHYKVKFGLYLLALSMFFPLAECD